MRRSIAEIQRQFISQALPQVSVYWAQITAVLFPAHAFKVQAAGYSGPSVVRADDSIPFGSLSHQLVFRGNDVKIERNPRTGEWHATAYSVSLNCVPTTNLNPPSVPLPTYSPPIVFPGFPPFPPFPPLPPMPPFTLLPPTTILPKPKPKPKPIIPPGKGKQAYVSTHRGLAGVTGAYAYGTATGTNLLPDVGWTIGAGWTESPVGTFAHTSGTAVLSHSAAITIAETYRVKWTVTGRTTGSFTVSVGGVSLATQTTSGYLDALASSTASLTFTPTTDFNGTLSALSMIDVTALLPVWTNLSATKITATTGTVTQSAYTVTGVGTHFTTECAVGDRLILIGADETITAIASDTSMTVDTSATVTPGETFTLFRPKAGLVAGAPGSLVIRWFVVDPFSLSGGQFTAGWAMTDSGLYRVTGLPTTPVWTQQLSNAAAAALIGAPSADVYQTPFFSPSVRKAGFIAKTILWWPGSAGQVTKTFTAYSPDYGTTWQTDATKYILSTEPYYRMQKSTFVASQHLDNIYYLAGWGGSVGYYGDQDHSNYAAPVPAVLRSPGAYAGAFPQFSPGMSMVGYTYWARTLYIPYCDNVGTVYSNDDRAYLFDRDNNIGTIAILRVNSAFTPLWSAGYAGPIVTQIGDPNMGRVNWLFSNMFNEDYAVALETPEYNSGGSNTIWLTKNLSGATPTWTRNQNVTMSGRVLLPEYLFCVPVDKNIVFFTGSASAGIGLPCFTADFGVTFIDISLYGQAGALDAVMQLTATADMTDSQIFVDFWKV